MIRLLRVLALGILLGLVAKSSTAQTPVGGPLPVQRLNSAVGMNGLYGTSYGVASFGVPRTYSTYSSSYGAGYGYGYPAYGFIPSKFGVGLWRPGFVAPGYVYGSANGYRTFPYPYTPGGPMYGPSIGVFAPGFGPSQPTGLMSY